VEHHAKPQKPEDLSPFERFWDFTRRIIAVPKAEIDEQEAEYQRQKGRQPRTKVNQTIRGDG
jgi:hypothetical protein